MSTPIVISLPGYVSSRGSVASLAIYNDNANTKNNSVSRSKKRRLDHLSWEEKVLRKKLKNRVAAQTSRDRKKAKMDEMEHSLSLLSEQNDKLAAECQGLRNLYEKVLSENADLRERMASTCCKHQVCSVGCDTANKGPAVSTHSHPLLKGRVTQPAAHLLLKILMTYLLLPISADSTQTSMQKNLKNLPKVYSKISLESLRQLVKQKIARGGIAVPTKNALLPAWWGRHQNSWNPVDVKA